MNLERQITKLLEDAQTRSTETGPIQLIRCNILRYPHAPKLTVLTTYLKV